MEYTGVTLDTVALKQSSEELTTALKKLEKEIYELAGMKFNINSARQVGEVLFDHLKIEEKARKTKTGSYSTSEEILEKMRSKHPVVGKLLEYRGLKKLLSTYIDALPELINPETGKPYINTLAAVAISPAGASPEKSTYVAQAVDVIRQSGLPSETNAMFTNIEGDIDDVLKVIRDATMKLAGQGYRTDVVIRLDIRPGFEGQIHAKQALVDEILSE